jgi:hypothetical protein
MLMAWSVDPNRIGNLVPTTSLTELVTSHLQPFQSYGLSVNLKFQFFYVCSFLFYLFLWCMFFCCGCGRLISKLWLYVALEREN